MSGRAMGYCAGNDAPGFTAGPGRGMGRGMGPGMGRGMAWRNARGFGLAPTREEELQSLKHQAERLQRTLDEVNQRIKDLGE